MNRNANRNRGHASIGAYSMFLGANIVLLLKLTAILLKENEENFYFSLIMWGRSAYNCIQQVISFNSAKREITRKKIFNTILLFTYAMYMGCPPCEKTEYSWNMFVWQTVANQETSLIEEYKDIVILLYIIIMLLDPVVFIARKVWGKIKNNQGFILFRPFIQCLSWPIRNIPNLSAGGDCFRHRKPDKQPKRATDNANTKPVEKARKFRDIGVQTQPIKFKKQFLNFPERYRPKHPPCIDNYMNTDLLCTDPFFDYFALSDSEKYTIYSCYHSQVSAEVQAIKFQAARYIIQNLDEFIANPEEFKYRPTKMPHGATFKSAC